MGKLSCNYFLHLQTINFTSLCLYKCAHCELPYMYLQTGPLFQKTTFPHSKQPFNFTLISSLKILWCATKRDLLLFASLWYINKLSLPQDLCSMTLERAYFRKRQAVNMRSSVHISFLMLKLSWQFWWQFWQDLHCCKIFLIRFCESLDVYFHTQLLKHNLWQEIGII